MNRSLVAVAAMALWGSGCAHFSIRTVEAGEAFSKTVEGPFKRIEVATASGNVRIHGVPGAAVSVSGRVQAWAGDAQEARALARQIADHPPIKIDGDSVRVGHLHEDGVSIDYDITVPVELAARIDSASGEVEVSDLQGTVKVDSASGEVKVRHAGAAKVNSASGAIVLEDIAGDIDIDSSSGDISIDATPTASWRVSASSGDITLRVPQSASFRFDAETSSGQVSTDLAIRVKGSTRGGELHGEVGDGQSTARVEVSTSSGDIRLK